MSAEEYQHEPVLIDEVMDCLQPHHAGVYVDGTFGRGGYARRILSALGNDGRVIALDVDPDAIAYGEQVFGNDSRLFLRHANYGRIVEELKGLSVPGRVNGMVFDLGVSSPQFDDAARGFSFRRDGPLDMRMNPHAGQSAADWVNTVEPAEMMRVISRLGEEKLAGLITRAIVRAREQDAVMTTGQLADIVCQAFPERERRKRRIHPATKVFQAIRMQINDELGHLEQALSTVPEILMAGGVLVVVSFHSLEDRMVKHFFRDLVEDDKAPVGLPLRDSQLSRNYEYVAKLIRPSDEEVEKNARARSARLRAIRKI